MSLRVRIIVYCFLASGIVLERLIKPNWEWYSIVPLWVMSLILGFFLFKEPSR